MRVESAGRGQSVPPGLSLPWTQLLGWDGDAPLPSLAEKVDLSTHLPKRMDNREVIIAGLLRRMFPRPDLRTCAATVSS